MRLGNLSKNLLLALLVTVPTLELASWVGLRVLASRGFVYESLALDEPAFREYLAERDPVTGWSATAPGEDGVYDRGGARRSPAYPDPDAAPCVAVFGDSYTFGADGTAEDAYPNQLARLLRCPVRNFGIPGYGTDQALLRYRAIPGDAPVVVLGHHAVDIVRNVNRFRNFLGGAVGVGLKPRFVLEDGDLALVPLPDLRSAEAVNALGAEGRSLDHEYFEPGRPSGLIRAEFPFTASLVSFASNWRVRAQLAGIPPYAPFYDPEHPSGALPLTAAILGAFDREARERGQVPVVLVLPGVQDLAALRDGEPACYEPLIDALEAAGVSVPDVAGAMRAFAEQHDVCDLFVDCTGHFTPAGNRIVAEVLAQWITARNAPRAPTPR